MMAMRGGRSSCPLVEMLHTSQDSDHHCLASISMWYEIDKGEPVWTPSWCRFVPDSASLSVSHETSESAILVSGIAGVMLLDGHGRIVRKLPNRDVDGHTVTAPASDPSAPGYTLWNGSLHLKGRVTSINAWFMDFSADESNLERDGHASPFQIVTFTQIDYPGHAGAFQRTLSLQIQAPDALGSIQALRCSCGMRAAKTVVNVLNIDTVSKNSLLDQSSRCCMCCSQLLPKHPDGRRRRRCDFVLIN